MTEYLPDQTPLLSQQFAALRNRHENVDSAADALQAALAGGNLDKKLAARKALASSLKGHDIPEKDAERMVQLVTAKMVTGKPAGLDPIQRETLRRDGVLITPFSAAL